MLINFACKHTMRIHIRVVLTFRSLRWFLTLMTTMPSASSVYKITYIIDLLTKVDINLHLRMGTLDVVTANNCCDVVDLLLSSHDITQFSVVISLQFKS